MNVSDEVLVDCICEYDISTELPTKFSLKDYIRFAILENATYVEILIYFAAVIKVNGLWV